MRRQDKSGAAGPTRHTGVWFVPLGWFARLRARTGDWELGLGPGLGCVLIVFSPHCRKGGLSGDV